MYLNSVMRVSLQTKSIEFDDSILDEVGLEVGAITGLASWDITQLNTYNATLKQGLSFYDSAISDIDHARMGMSHQEQYPSPDCESETNSRKSVAT